MGAGSSNSVKTPSDVKKSDETNDSGNGTESEHEEVTKSQEDSDSEDDAAQKHDHLDDNDDWSIDSNNSDDTLGLARRMRHYDPKYDDTDGEDTDNENNETAQVGEYDLIDIIAKENQGVYDSEEKNADLVTSSQSGNKHDAKEDESLDKDDKDTHRTIRREQTTLDAETYEAGTIGYYIAIANNDARTEQENNHKKEPTVDKTYISEFLDDKCRINEKDNADEKQTKPAHTSLESAKKTYGLQPKAIPRTVSNRQTLVLVKVGNAYKYVAVPAYLPSQKVYKPNTIAKKHRQYPAYKALYTRDNGDGKNNKRRDKHKAKQTNSSDGVVKKIKKKKQY